MEWLLSSKRRASRVFSCKHWHLCSLPSRRASRNCSKGLEETLLDTIVNVSAIVVFIPICLHDGLTGSRVFNNDRAIYWACADLKKWCLGV